MLQLLIFATVWNGESQTKLSAPGLYFGQEDVHFAGIKIGGMPGFPGCGFLTGDEVGVCHLFAAEIGLLGSA